MWLFARFTRGHIRFTISRVTMT